MGAMIASLVLRQLRSSQPFRFSVMVLSLLTPFAFFGAPQGASAATESSRLEGIQSLGLASLPGNMPTFYSPRSEARARYLQALLGGEIDYYSSQFQVRFAPVTMAVLNTEQWSKVAGEDPYGMPSVGGSNPYVFVMPSSWAQVTWMPFPKRGAVPAAILRQALTKGKTWDEVKFEGCDGIGTHEIGHTIIDQLGIDPQTHWFNEFLASYVGYAYLKAKHPPEALASEIFWTQGLDVPHPFTKLSDFESKYDELEQKHPANYGWYQLALDQRVMEIYPSSGVQFLRSIRSAFPKHGPRLDSNQVLEKLEALSPGWKSWSMHVEAGDVEAVKLPPANQP
jgi:hypothetical protein